MNDTALDTWYGLTEGNVFAFNHSASLMENFKAWKGHTVLRNSTQTDLTRDLWDSPVGKTIPLGYVSESKNL